jgi:hypothetical protein
VFLSPRSGFVQQVAGAIAVGGFRFSLERSASPGRSSRVAQLFSFGGFNAHAHHAIRRLFLPSAAVLLRSQIRSVVS